MKSLTNNNDVWWQKTTSSDGAKSVMLDGCEKSNKPLKLKDAKISPSRTEKGQYKTCFQPMPVQKQPQKWSLDLYRRINLQTM
ncbi:MAG: hypothetical protein J6X18_05600 [Bacteroidales bacterium]|nr:hypothetical protein [Bacteroidales bacterium]